LALKHDLLNVLNVEMMIHEQVNGKGWTYNSTDDWPCVSYQVHRRTAHERCQRYVLLMMLTDSRMLLLRR